MYLAYGAFTDVSAQTPLRDLRVGNKFFYDYSYKGGSLFTRPPIIRTSFEEVIGDTLLQGKRYAKIFNSANSSFRFERSSDTAIYIWNGTGETMSYNWMAQVSDEVYTSVFGNYSTLRVFQVQKVGSVASITGDTVRSQSMALYIPFAPLYSHIRMQKGLGVISASISYSGTAPSQAFSYSVSQRGAIIGGKVLGDTSSFIVTLRLPSLTRGIEGDTVIVPIYLDGYAPNIGIAGWAYCDMRFDPNVLRLLNPPFISTTQSGDTTKLVYFPVKPDSLGLLHQVRFVVLHSTTDSTIISITRFQTIFDDNPYQFRFTSGVFQKQFPVPYSVSVPNINIGIGERTAIPITLTGIQKMAASSITTASVKISFNTSILEPLAPTPLGTVQNGIRTIPITFNWSQPPNSDSITIQLPFRTAVGNADSTLLSLEMLPIISTDADVRLSPTVRSGVLTLRGINQAGTPRGLFFSERANISLAPIPADKITYLSYNLSMSSRVEVSIYNLKGEAISRIPVIMQDAGLYNSPIFTDTLPSGTYAVIVTINGVPHRSVLLTVVH